MKLALTAFTTRGGYLAQTLAQVLTAQGNSCREAYPEKLASALKAPAYSDLRRWTEEQFLQAEGLIFVGACGIAVRAIAPFVRDKYTDPAVVSLDEFGRYVVPLLSGHVGGANNLAGHLAALTGGTAVLSTATDVNGVFAVDQWAVRKGLTIRGREAAKRISASLLAGACVYLKSDFPIQGQCPGGVIPGAGRPLICVTARREAEPNDETLLLVPKMLNVGIGCRRGTPAQAVTKAVEAALESCGLSPGAVRRVCTISLKGDEPGLLAFCRERGLPLTLYTAEELQAVPGEFTSSAFVAEVTGVDNVCERAAVRAGGELIVKKRAEGGVTVAVSQEPYVVSFD